MRVGILIVILIAVFSSIAAIFWYQEIQYLLPTPVPTNYRVVSPSQIVKFDSALIRQQNVKPKLLHFFSPDCPCSRFNVKHFLSLSKRYRDVVDFYVVIAKDTYVGSAQHMVGAKIPVIVDRDEKLAKACGVYSTPQAALIQQNNQLYFRGNHNRSRYCTNKNSNFVQMALDSLIAGRTPPHFIELATESYGCSISEVKNLSGI